MSSFIVTVVINVCVLFVARTDACQCLFRPHPQQAYCESNTVVRAQVEAANAVYEDSPFPDNSTEHYPRRVRYIDYRIVIIEVYKGNIPLMYYTVRTAGSGAMCGMEPLYVGNEYVLTGYNNDGRLFMGSCGWDHGMAWILEFHLIVNNNPYADNCKCTIVRSDKSPTSCAVYNDDMPGNHTANDLLCKMGADDKCTWMEY